MDNISLIFQELMFYTENYLSFKGIFVEIGKYGSILSTKMKANLRSRWALNN